MNDDNQSNQPSEQPSQQPGHQQWREQLGVHALGHLTATEHASVQAHLDGCADCRAELAEIAPLAGLLETVNLERFAAPPVPPADLGARIRSAVAHERDERDEAAAAEEADELAARRTARRQRRTTRLQLVSAAAALVVVALVGGLLTGRALAPPEADPVYELVSLRDVGSDDVSVAEAEVIPHTWGVELRMEGAGFDQGQTYQAAFRTDGGQEMVPAGEFLGTGDALMSCHLQSSVLREDVDQVVVTDEQGETVLVGDL